MNDVIFSFPGTSQVIQAEQLLLEAALDVRVMPLPPSIRAGCGLCLRLPRTEAEAAETILKNHEVFPQIVEL